MNKKGVVVLGVAGIVLLAVTVVLFVVLSISQSSAIFIHDSYNVGELVKINLESISDYEVKIQTPSTTFLKRGSNDVFIFRTTEAGEHALTLKHGEVQEVYVFSVTAIADKVFETPHETENDRGVVIPGEDDDGSLLPAELLSEYDTLLQAVETGQSFATIRDSIIVGTPVEHVLRTALSEENKEAIIHIPSESEDIRAFIDVDGILEKVPFSLDERTLQNSLSRVISLNRRAGYTVIQLNDVSGIVEIRYQTAAPELTERAFSDLEKEVRVSSPVGVHYEHVIAETTLPELLLVEQKDLLSLYWKEEKRHLDFEAVDSDGNGFIDGVSWVVPHLSDQNFVISIDILTVQSYPVVGGEWQVAFTTFGSANLTIETVDGTSWSKQNDLHDLRFIELRCGDEVQIHEWDDGVLFIEDYSCDEPSVEISKVLTAGPHTIAFTFGDETAYAYNEASLYQIIGEWGRVTNLPQASWTSVTFNHTFNNTPVVVHSTEYDYTYTDNPCHARIRNVNTTGFEIRTESWDSGSFDSDCPATGVNAYWLAMEHGIHAVSDNGNVRRTVEVTNFTMSASACGSGASPTDWTYTENERDFQNAWTNQPLVLANVQSAHDDDMIATYVHGCGGSQSTEWNNTCIEIGLNGLENDGSFAPCTEHTLDEEGGYIAWEMDSDWSDAETRDNNGTIGNDQRTYYWEAFWESDNVQGSQNDPAPADSYFVRLIENWTEGAAFGSGIRIDGGNGLIPAIDFDPTSDQIFFVADEDEHGDSEQSHTAEPWQILFFNSTFGFLYSNETNPPPIISDVNATDLSDSSANITWNTDIVANSTVSYGTTASLGTTTGINDEVLNHSVLITGLSATTLYYYNVTSCSEFGICVTNGTYNFTTIVGTPPTIFNITPANNTNVSSPVILSVSTSEDAYCQWNTTSTFVYGTGTNFTDGQGTLYHNTSLGALSNGEYTYYVKCEDTSGNPNTDSDQGATTFTVDAENPVITLTEPISGELDTVTDTLFNWSVSDNLATSLTCDLLIDGVVQEQDIGISSGADATRNVEVLFGAHNWTVRCTDSVGNVGSSTSWFAFGEVTTNLIGEVGNTTVNATDWTLINFTETFTVPVVVAGYEFPYDNSVSPVSVRLANVTSSSFEVRLEVANSTASAASIEDLNLTYFVVEQGTHYMQDGTRIEAYRYDTSTVSSSGNGWSNGDSKEYNHTYAGSPIILHQVMSYNDATWISTFVSGDGDETTIPNSTNFQISLNGAEGVSSHGSETIGYIVIEMSNGTNNNLLYDSTTVGDVVEGVDNDGSCTAYSVSLNSSYSSTPLAISSQQKMDGNNGGWSHVCNVSTSQIHVRVDEDQFNDGERAHTAEEVVVFAFESAGLLFSNLTVSVPIISEENATDITDSSATITWVTNISSNSSVYYGLPNGTFSQTGDSSSVLNHSINLVGLQENTTYFYVVESCDTACNMSGTFNFTTLIGTPPFIFNITPENNTIALNPVTLAASTSENAYCEYSTTQSFVYGMGTTFSGGQGTTYHSTSLGSLSEGTYTYYIKCEDENNNTNVDSDQGVTTFSIDETEPTIILNAPAAASNENNPVLFNWTVFDNLDSLLVCNLTVNSAILRQDLNVSNGTDSTVSETLSDGAYSWNVTCVDDAANVNTSETRSFSVGALILVNVSTDSPSYNQGASANISVNTTDLLENSLVANVTTDIILGQSLENSTVWWNSSWLYRQSLRVIENSESVLTEHQINFTFDTAALIGSGNMSADCSDIRVVDSNNGLLPFYIQNSSSEGNGCNSTETLIWTQLSSVDINDTPLIYVYYGNNTSVSWASDLFATFDYSSHQDLYYVVSGDITQVDVVSFVDGNNVSNGTDYVSLDQGNVTTFDVNQTGIISAVGPVFASGRDNAVDALLPLSYAGTEFVYAVNRYNDVWHVYSPYENATVCVHDGEDGSGWTLVSSCFTVTQGNASTFTRNVGASTNDLSESGTDAVWINSTAPVLIAHDNDNSGDAFPLIPANTDWWGVPGAVLTVGVLEDSTTIQFYWSNGTNINFSRDEGEDIFISGLSNGGQEDAVHIIANNPVGVTQEADQDGSEMTTFLPETELDTEYFVPHDASYIAVSATVPNTDCTLYDDTGSVLSSATTSGNDPRPFPSKWFYGPSHNGNNIPAGSRLLCTNAVFAYYEQFGDGGDDDEHNLFGVKAFRKSVNGQPSIGERGTQETFIARDMNTTASDGIYTFLFDTTPELVENYTVVTLSERDGLANGTGQQAFEILPPVVAQAPNVTLYNPATGTFQNTSTITLFYNVSDSNDNLANATLILNGFRNVTNTTVLVNDMVNNLSVTLEDGVYNWTVNVTDDTSLTGTDISFRNFTIDTQQPVITLYSPTDGEDVAQSDVFFNFSITDNLDLSMVCDLVVDGSVLEDDFAAANGTVVNFTETLTAGLHFWNVTCVDNAGNRNLSETRNFTITEAPPTVELITPTNTYSTTGNITLVYNATDNNAIENATLVLDGVFNQSNESEVLNGLYSNFSLTTLGEGSYDWTVNVTDSGGLNATASERTFIIDLNDPVIALNLPEDNYESNSSSVSFNFTVNDTIDTSLTCDLSVGSQSDTGFSATNGSVTNRVINNLVDGVHVWNVTCTDDSGRSGFSVNRNVNVSQRPTIALQTANNSFFNVAPFELNYTPTDNTGFNSCDLYINGALNQSNQSAIVNGVQNNFTMDPAEGIYEWYVRCQDIATLENESERREFTVDFTDPSINLTAPDNEANLFVSAVEFNFTVLDNLDTSLICNITVNGVVEDADFAAANGTTTNRSVAFAQGGVKWWNVTCTDDSGNFNISETRNFTLSFAPQVTLTDPPSDSFHNSSTIPLFYSVSDDNNNLANATLILDGLRNATNSSELLNEQENNITVALPDGFYSWTINVTDDTNLHGTDLSIRNFTIDTHAPNITLKEPLNNTIITWNNFTYNFSVVDNLDTTLACNIYVNNALNHTVNATAGTDTLLTSILPDGNYLWNITCMDDSNNTGESRAFNFTMEAPPNVTLNSPENNFSTNTSSITFRYFVDDPIGINNCSIYIDGALNDSTTEPIVGSENTFDINDLAEGHHNWTVSCFDASPDFNEYRPDVQNFTVDQAHPLITLLAPPNNANVLATADLNFSVVDNLDLTLDCDLYVDSALTVANISAANGTTINNTLTGLALGQHFWNVSCVDNAQNFNWSETWQFNVTSSDLSINHTDIVFNNSNPTENETIEINATVHNVVNATVTDVVVQFYEGDPDGNGTQIGNNQTISEIEGLGTGVATVTWDPVLGTTQIYVLVDPPLATNGSIEEFNESNNEANRSIIVGGWQFVYGEISAQSTFNLSDQNFDSVLVWNASTFDNGTIYVTDYESTITWPSLQAIAQSSSDADTFNDFADLDAMFNMTGFIDSITALYTNTTDTLNETGLFVFNTFIDEIPIANSTNNTNFLTGILWDTADDVGDGEFSQDDREDVVFLTDVNENQPGAYGTYDYEIRIPAKLREYDPTDSQRAIFYVELS